VVFHDLFGFSVMIVGLVLTCDEPVLGPQVLPLTPSAGTFARDNSVLDISVLDGVRQILWRKSATF